MAWDLLTHLLVTLLSLAIFAAYQDEATVGTVEQVRAVRCAMCSLSLIHKLDPCLKTATVAGFHLLRCILQALGTFSLLMAYGAAVIPLAYAYSFSYTSPSAAQVCLPRILRAA